MFFYTTCIPWIILKPALLIYLQNKCFSHPFWTVVDWLPTIFWELLLVTEQWSFPVRLQGWALLTVGGDWCTTTGSLDLHTAWFQELVGQQQGIYICKGNESLCTVHCGLHRNDSMSFAASFIEFWITINLFDFVQCVHNTSLWMEQLIKKLHCL